MAGDLDVRIGGGVTVVRTFLAAGCIDAAHVVQVPILLGRLVRLWDGLEDIEDRYDIEAVSSPTGVTHLTLTRRCPTVWTSGATGRSCSSSVGVVPDASDPSFAREERRARARLAAAEASPERQQELRSRHTPPPPPPRERRTATARRSATDRETGSVDVAAVAASARAALDAHPYTWTSYAELCSANRLDRGLALVIARRLVLEPTGDHWFRIRDSEGVYNAPTDEAVRGDLARYSRAEADRLLEAIGVRVVRQRADPDQKLLWMHGEWCLAGR